MTTRKDAKIYDSRVMERYVRAGAITEEAAETYMKSMPDETNNAQWVQLDLHDAELGDSSGPDGSGSDGAEEES